MGSTENAEAVENADCKIQDITEQLAGLSNMNHSTAKLTVRIGENTQENCNAVEHVSAATEENSTGTESLIEIVKHKVCIENLWRS